MCARGPRAPFAIESLCWQTATSHGKGGSQRRISGVFVLLAIVAIAAPQAQAATPSAGGPVDLLTEANVTMQALIRTT